MKPKRKQKIKWSPKLAYVVGLLVTDGNLSSDKRHLTLVSKDIQLLKIFKKLLNLKNKIGLRKSGYTGKKDCHHVQFGDVVLYKWLLKVGLTPNKTKIIKGLKIPPKYFFDFLRGCFDGDGSSYSYWDSRWANSFMFYIAFSSGNLSYLKWLRAKLKNYLKINGHIVPDRNSWKLCYAKRESRVIFKKMYYKENLPSLKRKYKKLKIAIDTDDNIKNRRLNLRGRVVELADTAV